MTNHKTIQQRILNNEDDLYIVSNPPQEIDLYSQPFLNNPLIVVANKHHNLAGKTQIPIASLDGEAFIMREQGSGTREAVLKLFNQNSISVKVRLELGSNEAIKQAIAGGLGISVLSEHCLVSEGKSGELAILDVEHFPIERRWYVSHIAGKKLSTIAKTFLDYLLEESPKITFPSS